MNPTDRLYKLIRDVPDFPTPGVMFKDITPLLQDAEALQSSCDLLAEPYKGAAVDLVVGMESRGFIFGPAVAMRLGAGFGLARKKGKLPWETVAETYELEYGSEEIEMHRDTVQKGQRVLLIDDVIATGGTAAATSRLVRSMGGEVVAACFLIELGFLDGRKALDDTEIRSILTY